MVTSFEAFLELLYQLYDMNEITYDFDSGLFEKFEHIKLLPPYLKDVKESEMIDFPLLYVGIDESFNKIFDSEVFSSHYDNAFLLDLLRRITFDRNRSIELYMKIKRDRTCNIYEEFISSDNMLNDMVIWSFFEEANFIYSDEREFHIIEGEHRHYDFKNSKIDKKINNLLISKRIKTWI